MRFFRRKLVVPGALCKAPRCEEAATHTLAVDGQPHGQPCCDQEGCLTALKEELRAVTQFETLNPQKPSVGSECLHA